VCARCSYYVILKNACLSLQQRAHTHLMRRVLVTKELKSYLSEMPPTALSRLDIHPDTT
jgi:hypothetical protein